MFKAKTRKIIGQIEIFEDEIEDGQEVSIQYTLYGITTIERNKARKIKGEIFFLIKCGSFSKPEEKMLPYNKCIAVFENRQTVIYERNLWQRISEICWNYEDNEDVHEKLIELVEATRTKYVWTPSSNIFNKFLAIFLKLCKADIRFIKTAVNNEVDK